MAGYLISKKQLLKITFNVKGFMYKYLEIIDDDTKEVVSRLDISSKSKRQIDRIFDGASINLNHNKYSIQITESETELPLIR